jgi:lipoprotein-anchoring transpeptidase ErfK/SrfK
MVWRSGLACLFVVFALKSTFAQTSDSYSVEIDLEEQTAYLVRDGRVVLSTPIASGRYGHLTETGSFKIIEKERSHFSTLYGKIVDASGRTVVSDADADMPVPRGGRFIPAPMRYFMRFNESIGMHAGYLPGYPASHGCVRLPEENAVAFFNALNVGTPVTVFGRTPRGRSTEEARLRTQGYRPQFVDPRFDQLLTAPWWWR